MSFYYVIHGPPSKSSGQKFRWYLAVYLAFINFQGIKENPHACLFIFGLLITSTNYPFVFQGCQGSSMNKPQNVYSK